MLLLAAWSAGSNIPGGKTDFSFLNKQVTRNSFPQILASCSKTKRLTDFPKVSVLYPLVVPIGSPKAAPTVPTCVQTIPGSPHSHLLQGLLLIHPPVPLFVLGPLGVSSLQSSFPFCQHHKVPLRCHREGRSLLSFSCCQRNGGFPGDSRDRDTHEPPWP